MPGQNGGMGRGIAPSRGRRRAGGTGPPPRAANPLDIPAAEVPAPEFPGARRGRAGAGLIKHRQGRDCPTGGGRTDGRTERAVGSESPTRRPPTPPRSVPVLPERTHRGEPAPTDPGEPEPTDPGAPDRILRGEPDPPLPGAPGEPEPTGPGDPNRTLPGAPDPSRRSRSRFRCPPPRSASCAARGCRWCCAPWGPSQVRGHRGDTEGTPGWGVTGTTRIPPPPGVEG